MAPIIIQLDKTLQDRLDEYRYIFGDEGAEFNKSQSGSVIRIKDVWRNHLSVMLHSKGWEAIWKIPTRKCNLMNIKYPSEFLVKVNAIDWDTFSATVEILQIDDNDIPSCQKIADLCELYPVEQEIKGCDAVDIANELDKYRFFYEYLWYPWDEFEEDSLSWSPLIEERLQLLYDMVTGEMNAEDTERIRYLIHGARDIQAELQKLDTLLEDCKSEVNGKDSKRDECQEEDMECVTAQVHKMDTGDTYENNVQNEREESLMVKSFILQRKLENIQHEFEFLENPCLRRALTNDKMRRYKPNVVVDSSNLLNRNTYVSKNEVSAPSLVVFIWGKSGIEKLKKAVALIESKFTECEVTFYPRLQQAVNEENTINSAFVLCPGLHKLKHNEELLYPGTIITGYSQDLETNRSVILGHSFGKVMIIVDWRNGRMSPTESLRMSRLENLHFDPYGLEAVLLIDEGAVTIHNCKFSHEDEYSNLPVIGKNAEPCTSVLETYCKSQTIYTNTLKECQDTFYNQAYFLPVTAAFDCPPQRGIAIGVGGMLQAQSCSFERMQLAIIAYSGAKVSLYGCTFSQCHVAIRISIGARVTIENCTFDNNKVHSIHVLLGATEEQSEEVQKIMEGNAEIVTSSQILQRIPGITVKNNIFVSSEKKDVLLSSFSEIAHSPNLSAEETLNGNASILIEDDESGFDDSVVALS